MREGEKTDAGGGAQVGAGAMHKRRTTMGYGRYLIYYTFGEGDYGHYHFHIEFYPPLRTATKMKYLAGSETGAGMFINDTLAEEKAAELRARVAPVEWRGRAG